MNDKLSHLGQAQINELIRRYYHNDKIAGLIKEYNLDIKPGQLVKAFPSIAHDIKCRYCNTNLFSYYQSKNSYNQISNPECSVCGHEETPSCYCSNCKKLSALIKQREQNEKQDYLTNKLQSISYKSIEFDSLTFPQRVYLGAFLRSGASENLDVIEPIGTFIDPLAPTESFQDEIIGSLCSELFGEGKPLIISALSDTNSFPDLKINGSDFSHYLTTVKWDINVIQDGASSIELIERLRNPSDDIYTTEELYYM